MLRIIGKAQGKDHWIRSEIVEEVSKASIDDIILMSDIIGTDIYRVVGGYGFHPMHLSPIEWPADNDPETLEEHDLATTLDDASPRAQ